jgi:hypothetical protein
MKKVIFIVIALSFLASAAGKANAATKIDTVKFTYQSAKTRAGQPVVVLDGKTHLGKDAQDALKNLRADSIAQFYIYKDSVNCAEYGKEALENGLLFIVTKGNEDKIKMLPMPKKMPEKAKPDFTSYWKVAGGDCFDSLPSFGDSGDPGAFDKWLDRNAVKFNPGKPYNDENYGMGKVSFRVTRKGEVKDVKIILGRSERFDKCVVDLVGSSPNWHPAMKNGKPKQAIVTYPIFCYFLIK